MNLRWTWTAALVSNCLFTGLAVLLDLTAPDEAAGQDMAFSVLVILSWIAASLFWAILHFKCWQSLPSPYSKISPEKAVGFLFIPFYNFYWAFVSFPELAKGFNARNRAESRPVCDGSGLGLAQAILFVATFTIGLIPGLASLVAIGSLVIFILYYRLMIQNAEEAQPPIPGRSPIFPPDMPPLPSTTTASPIYLYYSGQRHGPYTEKEVGGLNDLPEDAVYWKDGLPDWKPLSALKAHATR